MSIIVQVYAKLKTLEGLEVNAHESLQTALKINFLRLMTCNYKSLEDTSETLCPEAM